MKKNFLKFIAIVMMIFILSSCAPVQTPDDNDTATDSIEATDSAQATDEVVEETGDLNPPLVEKKEIKLLMIGNSFCTRYPEELYGIAKAAGYDLTVVSLYESGCPVADHWKWLNDGSREYDLYVTSTKYRGNRATVKVGKNQKVTIQEALDYAKNSLGGDWDVISLQQHFYPDLALDYNKAYITTSASAKLLYDRIREEHPDSLLLWLETWAYQVGYAVPEKYVEGETAPKDTAIADVETQTKTYETIKAVCYKIAEENGVNIVPCGDAWQIARADARVGDNMCARLDKNGKLGDYYHDGDIGGGQYLNGCVWFETLTGVSCIGNTWRPENYELSEEMIAGAQEAAHAAVAAVYGDDYAK